MYFQNFQIFWHRVIFKDFMTILDFMSIFDNFIFFLFFYGLLEIVFWFVLLILFWIIIYFFFDFFGLDFLGGFYGFLTKLLRLLLKVITVTSGNQKLAKTA